jgi:hypothetical protein
MHALARKISARGKLWIKQIEHGIEPETDCPKIYRKDKETILNWKERGVLGKNGVWQLHEK